MDFNPEMCLKMRENYIVPHDLFKEDDDNLSIE